MGAKNTPNLVAVYKKWGGLELMTPEQIMYGFQFVAQNDLERSPDFWNIIIPTVKAQVKTLDRMTIQPLLTAVEAAAAMYLQDNEFWESIEQKLIDENLLKYFSLEQMATLVWHLARVGRGSDEMIEFIEKYFIKHRKGLAPKTL